MASMNKIERVMAVLAGDKPDHPPISFWHHFDRTGWAGQGAVDAHARHLATFDLDFVKVMDDNRYPVPAGGPIGTVSDLKRITELNGEESTFGLQLDVLRRLKALWDGKVLFSTTVFNAWTTLRNLTQPPREQHGPPSLARCEDPAGEVTTRLLKEDRAATAAALRRIGASLANFASKAIQAGADGIFLSVRDDWVDTDANGAGTYDEIVRETDRMILETASRGRLNILHVCGRALNFETFAQYPVQAINWADRYAGPAIAYARACAKPALCAGLDNLGTLVSGTLAQCRAELADAVRQAGNRPIMIAPGCTYDPESVPMENLHATVEAARDVR
jgi:uroporphyrinogen decarboxylase